MYERPARLRLNEWALSGEWTVKRDAAVLNKPNGRIAYRFHARDLHLVMGPAAPGTSVRFRVLIDGQPPGAAHGIDVDEQGNGTVTEQRLYQLIRQPKPIARSTIRNRVSRSGRGGFCVHVRLIRRATIEPRRFTMDSTKIAQDDRPPSPPLSRDRGHDRRCRPTRHDRLRRTHRPARRSCPRSSRGRTRRLAR